MSEVRITTNNHARPIIEAYELTEQEREQLDWYGYDWEKIEAGEDGAQFFRYKGQLYDTNDYMRTNGNGDLKEWDGYSSDSFFSGTLVRYSDEQGYAPCHPDPVWNKGPYPMTHDPNTYGEYIVVGWFCS